MGGQPQTNNLNEKPLSFADNALSPVKSQASQPWQIENSHPELVTEGLMGGIKAFAGSALNAYAATQKPSGADATSLSQKAGNVGPVANPNSSPEAFKNATNYMRSPTFGNYLNMNQPESFSYNPNQ